MFKHSLLSKLSRILLVESNILKKEDKMFSPSPSNSPTPCLANNASVFHSTYLSRSLGSSETSHLHTQEVAQADLSDIVTDVLVILKISTSNIGITRVFSGIRLQQVSKRVLSKVRIEKQTMVVPVREG